MSEDTNLSDAATPASVTAPASDAPTDLVESKRGGSSAFQDALAKKKQAGRKVNRQQKVLGDDGEEVTINARPIDPDTESKHAE